MLNNLLSLNAVVLSSVTVIWTLVELSAVETGGRQFTGRT
jgi:hypothetical protein